MQSNNSEQWKPTGGGGEGTNGLKRLASLTFSCYSFYYAVHFISTRQQTPESSCALREHRGGLEASESKFFPLTPLLKL